ncbi:MAG: ATP-binding cassette domain-containing protein, partial [Bifidobacteriaceae bacterium]|nr:ATP-binding cassette domain-containing protein [Bifidobacteriaceae bacterium]
MTPTAAEAAAAPAGIVPGAAGGGTNALELAGASKRYAGKIAVDAVDLVAPPGQLVALLGASGSGKSTLLRLINRMAPPSGGTVKVFGRDVAAARGAALRSLRAEIGFIFQRFELVGPLSVWENVLTGASGRLRAPRLGVATYPRGWRQEALSHLERVGLADLARQRADTLSGGQQQRVAVARALMQRPRLVL